MVKKDYSVKEVYELMLKVARAGGQGSKDQKIRMLANMIASADPLEAKYLVRYPLAQPQDGRRGFNHNGGACDRLCGRQGGEGGAGEGLQHLQRPRRGREGSGRGRNQGGGGDEGDALQAREAGARGEAAHGRADNREDGRRGAVEQKYDGFRIQVHKKGKEVRLYSRKLENITEMFPDIIRAVMEEVDAERVIFEGEALAFNEATGEFLPFQETIQRKRKHGIEEKALELPLHLFAFDVLYYEGKEWLSKPYEERRELIEKLFGKGKVIEPTSRIVTSKPKELERFFESSIESGLEGIMAKDLKAPYIAGARKFSWVKLKRSYKGELGDTVDLVIVGYYLGRGARAEFGFGGLLCAVYNKKRDLFETISRIGTGFTEKQMAELKSTLSKIKSEDEAGEGRRGGGAGLLGAAEVRGHDKRGRDNRSPMHTCGKDGEGRRRRVRAEVPEALRRRDDQGGQGAGGGDDDRGDNRDVQAAEEGRTEELDSAVLG